jgi:hypothetical protein
MIAAALGWVGTVGCISAYVLLARGRMRSESVSYAALNLVGGMMGAGATAMYGAWSSVASNLIWAVVAGHGLVTALRARGDWPEVVNRMPYVTTVEDDAVSDTTEEPLQAA